MDKELNDYLLHKTAEHINENRKRQKEIDARLAHCHLVTEIQRGVALGLAGAIAATGLGFIIHKKNSSKEEIKPNNINKA